MGTEKKLEWTTKKPTKPGYYWIYVIPGWGIESEVLCAKVIIVFSNKESIVKFDIPSDGDECEDDIRPERTTHWMGPIDKPEPPEKLGG